MDGFSLLVLVIAGFLLSFGLLNLRRTANKKREEVISRNARCINRRVNDYLEQGIKPIESQIRSKRNEHILAEASFDLYRYKSTGRVAGQGFRYRTKIAQGLTYNAAIGQMYVNKDWLKNEKGLITISNQAITYTSLTNSKWFTWASLSKLEVFANGFVLTQSRGAVLMFECEELAKEHHSVLALLSMEHEKYGTLASAFVRWDKDNKN